jgi:RNA polymerase sigma factor (sigma-70 family)
MEPDRDLLTRLRDREDAAFAEFVERWAPLLERDLKNKGFSPADAWDLGFSCATQALIKLDSYKRGADGFDGWVLTVGRHFASDWRRRSKGFKFVPLSPSIPAQDDEGDAPDQEHSRASAALNEALSKLDTADRTLVDMRHLNGSSGFDEIAGALGISVNAARTRHHRVLRRLRESVTFLLKQSDGV